MRFDIVCTATLRPELLFKTFQSFNYNLFDNDIGSNRLILNIDLIGIQDKTDTKSKLSDVLGIVNSFNFREVIIRWTDKPNFATAWFWAMSLISECLVFYLEEDWLLLKKVNLERMINLFRKNNKLAHLRLSSFSSAERTCKNWNKFTYWNGEYFEVKGDDKFAIGWAGHPNMTRTEFIRQAMSIMNFNNNPEKQIKGRKFPCQMNKLLLKNDFGVFIERNESAQILDIGREWMKKNGFKKSGNKAFFTTWEKTNDD